jgi:molybdenum cofactor cytidylyltransferase
MTDFLAIILAGGESKRMGFPKMLLAFRGKTMVENVIGNVADSRVDEIVVVLGASSEKIIEKTEHLNVKHCFNENFKEGMLSSVKCGFRNLPAEYKAVLVFQGDQPLITPKVINSVIEAYLSSGKGLVIPVYNKRRGHPLLIEKRYGAEIEKLTAEEGLHALAAKFYGDVLEVEVDEPGILRDIDTYEEYENEINQIK